MKNGVTTSSKGSIVLERGDSFSPAITTRSAPTYHEWMSCERSGKRAKPARLSPRWGTSSTCFVAKVNLLQVGRYGNRGNWYPNYWKGYRLYDSWECENQWNTHPRGSYLIGTQELNSLIQNKIREKIMAGKAQAAVDIIQLGKTKDMMASAGTTLLHAFRALRGGRPMQRFVRDMNRTGFRSAAGKAWLQFIYGWVPTVGSIFEITEILAKNFSKGSIVTGSVSASLSKMKSGLIPGFGTYDAVCNAKAKGRYEYTVKDPKLLQLSHLGFTNPLSIAWEVLPWSFVLDWFVDVGGYINRMDFALGLSDVYWQYSCKKTGNVFNTYTSTPLAHKLDQSCISLVTFSDTYRSSPSNVITNSFKGLKPFTNQATRLTTVAALISQQIDSLKLFKHAR